jgi:hypothetical protein
MHHANANAVTWFEIGTGDPEGARSFYGGLFGWTFSDDENYQEVSAGAEGSIGGGIHNTGGQSPSYAIFYVEVADVAATATAAEAAGGKVLVPPVTNPNGLAFAHLLDPAGNHFGVFTPPAG